MHVMHVSLLRMALNQVHREQTRGDLDRRLTAVRNAAEHHFPVSDIDEMLADIERGY